MTRQEPELTDTDPRARAVQIELLRRMSPDERFSLCFQLSDLVSAFSEAGVRAAYPDASEREIFLRTAAKRLSREWMIRAYGWDPKSDAVPR